MSIVIVGGNDCMVRRYIEIGEGYGCNTRVFTQMKAGLKDRIGNPDLMILFTGIMSHKMLRFAMNEVKGQDTKVIRSKSASASALKNILEEEVAKNSEMQAG